MQIFIILPYLHKYANCMDIQNGHWRFRMDAGNWIFDNIRSKCESQLITTTFDRMLEFALFAPFINVT